MKKIYKKKLHIKRKTRKKITGHLFSTTLLKRINKINHIK